MKIPEGKGRSGSAVSIPVIILILLPVLLTGCVTDKPVNVTSVSYTLAQTGEKQQQTGNLSEALLSYD